MFTLLSTLISFLAGGLPKLLDFFQDRNDKKHEIELAQLQLAHELELRKLGFEAQQKIEEIHTEQIQIGAQQAETVALYANDNALNEGTSTWMKNLRASVRPVITYGFFLLLVGIDCTLIVHGFQNNIPFQDLAAKLWDSDTQTLFASIIAFHFGGRAFGK